MATGLDKLEADLLERVHALNPKDARPLWPAPYNDDTAQSGFKFVTECWWGDNTTDRLVELMPAKEYVEALCYDWHLCYTSRKPLLIEKSRRLIVSWICRGLETWQMGLKRGDSIIVDQTYENAAEHLWRIHFGLTELRRRRPEFRLEPHRVLGSVDVHLVDDIVLPNGSTMTQGYQKPDSEQGKGKTLVTLEEVSKYRNPSAYWSQAIILTMGAAGNSGGWVCGIANSSPNPDWKNIKGGVSARSILGLE